MPKVRRSVAAICVGGCLLVVSGLAWTGAPAAPVSVQHQAEARPAASYLPDGLVLAVTVRDGAGLVGGFRGLLDAYHFDQTPAYQALASNPGFVQARIGLLGLAAAAQTDAWEAAASLAGDEMVFGLTPGKGPDAKFIAVTVSMDPAVRARFLDQVRMATGLVSGGKPDPKRSRTIDGVTVYQMDNNLMHGESGNALIASNSEALFRAALQGRTDHAGGPEAYRHAAERVPVTAAAWVYFDVAAIKASAGNDGIQVLATNPLGGLIFGGAWRSILDAPSAVAWLTFRQGAAKVELSVASSSPLPDTYGGFLSAPAEGPGFNPASLPGYIGDLRVTRSWASLFAERESIMALPAAEQLVAFSNGVTTLMGQMDFVDDVLPRFAGPVYLVAARQDLSPRGYRPTPVLPAFAAVMPLKPGSESDGFAKRLYSASVMAVSAANLIATQQGQPAFIIDPDRYRDCRIVTAEYDDPGRAMNGGKAMRPAAAPAGDGSNRVNIRYNFAPAIGIVGDRYIIATSVDLLHTVIDGLLAEMSGGVPLEGDALTLDGPAVVAALADNREELVAGRMLDKNQSKAEAERDVDGILGLLKYARGLSTTYHQTADGFTGCVELRLIDPPAGGIGQ